MKLKWMLVLVMGTFLFACDSAKDDSTEQTEEIIDDSTVEGDISHGDNSRVSLDWSGTYKGLLPCADCEGIEAEVTLNEDETFHYKYVYLTSKEDQVVFEESGKFEWDAAGSKITLTFESELAKPQYRVGENHLLMLGEAGEIIEGSLADAYVLNKQ